MLQDELITYIRARYTLIYVLTVEEQRVLGDLEAFARKEKKKLVVWSEARGLRGPGVDEGAARDPLEVLGRVPRLADGSLVVLLDFHPYLKSPAVIRALRELGHELERTNTTLLILSPVLFLPPELQKDVVVVDTPLPGFALLKETFEGITTSLDGVPVLLSGPDVERLVRSAQGLTLKEFSNVLAKALVTRGRIDKDAIDVVNQEKRQVVRKSGFLEFYPVGESFRSIGGLESLKEWLVSRGRAFTEQARTFGLPWPKGVLIVGVQGCGKSLTAKAVADQWRLPLLKMDMGKLFGHLVGSSEDNMRRALQLAESIAPAVLWIDEIEKGLSGLGSSNLSDGGTSARVIGTFLTWMQEKQVPVFVVATANDIHALPPELLRKGRFDELFFVDLPGHEERKQVLDIHVKKRGRALDALDLEALAEAAKGHSGAELEEAVVSGMFIAFEKGRDLMSQDVLEALRRTVPLSVVMEERITALREWARWRTRPASTKPHLDDEQRATIVERLRRIAGNG